MSKESKILGGILVAIVVVMVGGFMLFGGSSSSSTTGTKVDAAKLTNADAQTIGTGKVQVVEFGDYQCPACGAAHPALKQLVDQNANDITFVFRDFPLQMHPNAKPAAYAANAAAVQGKFWEMHNKLYENQKEWVDLPDPTDVFVGYAQGLGNRRHQYDLTVAGGGQAAGDNQCQAQRDARQRKQVSLAKERLAALGRDLG